MTRRGACAGFALGAGLMGAAAGAWGAAPAAQAIPFKRDSGPAASQLGGAGAGVLVISLVAIAAVLFIRKRLNLGRPAGGGPRLLKVLETERLGPRALLSVVEFDGKRYLLAQGEHGISCVAASPASSVAGELP